MVVGWWSWVGLGGVAAGAGRGAVWEDTAVDAVQLQKSLTSMGFDTSHSYPAPCRRDLVRALLVAWGTRHLQTWSLRQAGGLGRSHDHCHLDMCLFLLTGIRPTDPVLAWRRTVQTHGELKRAVLHRFRASQAD